MADIERDFYNLIISTVINNQKNKNQPIYVIATYWCGTFRGIETYTTNGDFDKYTSSAVCYAWFIWVKGEYEHTELKWIY